ncbi:MAG TPA: 50S ribosomal protein L25 [Calditrichia bacterium]|nr:50S ribosomal protein L25 [Calditrichia bacterium]
MSTVSIQAEKRENFGSRSTRQLRRDGMVPGVIYAGGEEALPLTFVQSDINHFLNAAHGLIDLEVKGEKSPRKCILKDVQFDPRTDLAIHLDFLGVTLGEALELTVPLHLTGNAPGVKNGGILDHLLREITIKCLPLNIPDSLEVDISGLEMGGAIHVGDLSFENIEILDDPEESVVHVSAPRSASEETEGEEGVEAEEGEAEEDE